MVHIFHELEIDIYHWFPMKYPEFIISFRWALRDRCGYKFDARVAKATNTVEDDCQERCPCCYRLDWNIFFLNVIFSINFG